MEMITFWHRVSQRLSISTVLKFLCFKSFKRSLNIILARVAHPESTKYGASTSLKITLLTYFTKASLKTLTSRGFLLLINT